MALMKTCRHTPALCIVFLAAFSLQAALFSQTQPQITPPPLPQPKTAVNASQLEQQLKAAKRPKSDKWKLSLLPVGLQKNPQIDYAIVTELTDAGRLLPEPSFEKPVYYFAHSVGQKDVGDAYGGTREIHYKYLEKQLNNSLASNGYRATTQEDPNATQILFFSWGMHNRMLLSENMDDEGNEMGGASSGGDVSANTDDIMNLLSRAKTVGGQKFANEFARALSEQIAWNGSTDYSQNGPLRDFAERDENTEALVYEIFDDCYFMIVYSYDLEALRSNQKKLLWVTRISTTARGVSFEATLPIMINTGAYFFGRETNGVEILRKRAYKSATVEIGEATVIEFDPNAAKPKSTGAPKPAASGTAAPATSGTATPATSGTGGR